MRYYRLSFNKITTPDPLMPLNRKWHWYTLVCCAENKTLAKDHGHHVAYCNGIKFVDAIPLLKAVGAVEIEKCQGLTEI